MVMQKLPEITLQMNELPTLVPKNFFEEAIYLLLRRSFWVGNVYGK